MREQDPHQSNRPQRTHRLPEKIRTGFLYNLMEVMIAAHAEETSHLNLDENDNPLSFRTALAGPHRDKWIAALCDEYIRLTEETGTISWNAWDSKPKNHKATYCSMQVKEKMGEDGVVKYRVRLTVGGDRVEFHGERSLGGKIT